MIDLRKRSSTTGFSLVEALVALVVFLVVLTIVFSFFVDFGKSANTQSGNLDSQASARITVDELSRAIQQAGYGIDRAPSDDPSTWQRDVVYAGSHAFAFNADLDSTIGPIPNTVTLTFPTGDTYVGQGPSAATGGAETYVYTIDADDDNAITLADRSAAATGSYNPAAETPNPLDFALFKKIHGYKGGSYGGTLVPVAASLFTNATSAVAYPDGTTPEPIFEYWLTEDLDRSQSLANVECVVGTCPPSVTRLPKLYLWGDTDGNGSLSESEKSFIRDKPVGSAGWSKNPLTTSGAYSSTTLSSALSLSSTPYLLRVADATKFGSGMYVQVDTGADTEYAVVESVSTSPGTITLQADLHNAHPTGATVQLLPTTLLRAVRAVRVQYDSIAPVADLNNGAQVAGRAGRAGTKGLDYQVRAYDKTIELVNMATDPLVTASAASQACPLVTRAVCNGADATVVRAYVPSNTPTPLNFTVRDSDDVPVSGVTLTFSKTNSVGALSSTTTTSATGGLASTGYAASNVGDSTVTVSGTCIDQYFNNRTYSDTVLVKGTKLVATMTNDCLSTVSSRTTAPTTGFTVQAVDSGGPVANSPVSLSLQFDPAYLPVSPNFSNLQATLYIAGTAVGSTDGTGAFTPWIGDTGAGTITGSVVLNRDTLGNGAKVNLVVSAPADTCWPASGNLAQGVTYLKLNLASSDPSGCTESSPCLISAGTLAPTVLGTLSVNNTPVPGSTVTFSKTDFHPAPDTPAASSTFSPGATRTTDSSGIATVYVANNGSTSITSANPLATTVDATTLAEGVCTTPSITPVSLRPKFLYLGSSSAGACDADLQQSWMSGNNADMCVHVLDPNVSRSCPLRPTGIKVAVYLADGVTLDNTYTVKKIVGGTITTSSTSCTTGSNSKTLFQAKCLNPDGNLANNTQFNFQNNSADGCLTPALPANPGEYYAITQIQFSKNLPPTSKKMVVTLYYGCDGDCSTTPGTSETWTMTTPLP